MSDIFREVEEEYRQQKMAELWKKYRIPVVGGAAALILSVAGYQAFDYWRQSAIEDSAKNYSKAEALALSENRADKEKAAGEYAKLSISSSGGYPLVSRFQEAALRLELGDSKRASEIYDEIAKFTSDPVFHDLAVTRSALLVVETAAYPDLAKKLGPIADGTGPWKVLASETLAFAAFRAGKNDVALKYYTAIDANPFAPQGSKRRATEMKILIEGGLKPSDLKQPAGMPAQPFDPSMFLPPSEGAGSLLGPDAPAVPAIPTP